MENQEKELLFAGKLEEIRELAKQQKNTLSSEQVKECFAELELSEDRMQMIFDYLKGAHIGVDEAFDPDAVLSEDEKDYLQYYYDELALLPEYSDGQKKALTISAMAGEKDAQASLIQVYLKQVVEIAKLYSGQGVLLEDLIGEGNMALTLGTGLLGSQETPEECEGLLIKMVMDAMEELVSDTLDHEELAQKALKRVNKVSDKADALAEELGRKVTAEELMKEEHLTLKEVEDALRISGFAIDGIEE